MTTTTGGEFACTLYVEGEHLVYPCRCGKTHRGDYAFEDWNHHNCFHEAELVGLQNPDGTIQAICPECGASWKVEIKEDKGD